MNKQTKFITIPTTPGTNLRAKPEIRIEIGTRTPAENRIARNLSSGTHSPFRRFLHLMTVRSEM